MNELVLIESNDYLGCDLFLRVAEVVHKDFKLTDMWEEVIDCEKGMTFGNVMVVFENGRSIKLRIDHNSMSITRMFELYKACNEVILEQQGIV